MSDCSEKVIEVCGKVTVGVVYLISFGLIDCLVADINWLIKDWGGEFFIARELEMVDAEYRY